MKDRRPRPARNQGPSAPTRGASPARSAQKPRPADKPREPASAKSPKPAVPRFALEPLPTRGDWLWTCREGFEADLFEELTHAGAQTRPRMLAPALVSSAALPAHRAPNEIAFARQGFAVWTTVRAENSPDLSARVTRALRERAVELGGEKPWALQVWVADSEAANRFARSAELLGRAVELAAPMLDARWADRRKPNADAARAVGGELAQVCLIDPRTALVGGSAAVSAPSLHPGGRARMRVSSEAPSRAAMKLEEALDWLGHGPGTGETCTDLGAAPGGWTYVVMERGARVIAVDPGSMAPELMQRRGLTHVRGSAFDYEPPEAVDWLLCDMVWRPLEVAALLARWSKRRWARMLVANIKLPMRSKVEFVERVGTVLREGGWQGVRFRHLYHDREEVTLTAHLD